MSILIDNNTRLIVQGITGRDGGFHATKMKSYGTKVVGGTSPGKAGERVDGIPVFNTVKEAVQETGANTSVIFVPAPFAKDAMMEAADAGIQLIICITEGIPTLDVVTAHHFIKSKGAHLIGPNCPGLISPEKSLVGIMPTMIFKGGGTGVISRSGTLTYEVVYNLTESGMGQSTAVGVGGDPVVGLYYQELLEMFENDPDTDSIALIGEIGGDAEEQAAAYIKEHHETGRGIYRRAAGTPRETDGARGSHYLQRGRHRRREDRRVRSGRCPGRQGAQPNPGAIKKQAVTQAGYLH